jgi:hypothetical protein
MTYPLPQTHPESRPEIPPDSMRGHVATVAFLHSDATFSTGQTIQVDRGLR